MNSNKTEGVDLYPGHQYQRLFNAISDTNGIATQDELDEIIRIAHEDFPPSPPAGVEQRAKGGKWVKASERLPDVGNEVFIRTVDKTQRWIVKVRSDNDIKVWIDFNGYHYSKDKVEWLDETQSIAGSESQAQGTGFTLNDMKEAIRFGAERANDFCGLPSELAGYIQEKEAEYFQKNFNLAPPPANR